MSNIYFNFNYFYNFFIFKKKKIKESFLTNSVPEIGDDIFKRYNEMKKTREKINEKYDINYNPKITSQYLKNYKQPGVYKNVPLGNNSLLLNKTLDNGVLKNLRTNPFMNTYSEELYFGDINKLINTILLAQTFRIKYDSIIDSKGKLNKKFIHEMIVDNFVFIFNNSFKANKLNHKNHKFDKRKYNLLEYKIINDSPIKGISKENRNFIFNIILFKKDKEKHYSIQVDCNYNIYSKPLKVDFNNITVIGIIEQEKLIFNAYNQDNLENCPIEDYNNGDYKSCFRDDLKIKSLKKYEKEFQEKDVPKFLNQKKEEEKKHKEYQNYKCFLKKGFNKSICHSFDVRNNTAGVFDKPCNNNNECPFYKKNKNYENNRGGCVKGFCEMPLNIERVGYKNYRTNTKPFCHNCNIDGCLGDDCFTCCEEQKNDPNLNSPDYMFNNDSLERKNFL